MSGPLTQFGIEVETREQRQERILDGVLASVYRQVPQSVLGNLVGGVALVAAFWNTHNINLLIGWFIAMLIEALVRLRAARRFRESSQRIEQVHAWAARWVGLAASSGVLWGAAGVTVLLVRRAAAATRAGVGDPGRRLRLADDLRDPPAGALRLPAAGPAAAHRPAGRRTGSRVLHRGDRPVRGVRIHRPVRPQLRRDHVRGGAQQPRQRAAGRPVAAREARRRRGAPRGRSGDAVEDAVLRRRQSRPAPAAAGDRHLHLAAAQARRRSAGAAGAQPLDRGGLAVQAGRGTARDLAPRLGLDPAARRDAAAVRHASRARAGVRAGGRRQGAHAARSQRAPGDRVGQHAAAARAAQPDRQCDPLHGARQRAARRAPPR